MLIFSILLPIIAGVMLPCLHLGYTARRIYVSLSCAASCALSVAAAVFGEELTLISLANGLDIKYGKDGISIVFVTVFSLAWLLVSIYAPSYIKHEGHDDRFFSFFLLSLGALISLSFSYNLLTLYLSFELVTLASMPLVLHSGTKEAVAAALKYLFYSIAGALMGLFGIIFLYSYTGGGVFTPGGSVISYGRYMLPAVFLCILGFGTKAGMFPMHGWLPSAHPVAPAPASALLSGIIAKAGILAVIRIVFYTVGADTIRGTWVQTSWVTLASITILMGSMMAYREKLLKKRLAYSTVSNISYIMLGLSTLTPTGELGAILHFIAHAMAKSALFLSAGSIIYKSGKTSVDDLQGIGKQMPITMGAFTVASLSLIGIPPLLGFTSKWYLSSSGIESGGVLSAAVPAVLIISALLTAGYLLPIVINGYFPSDSSTQLSKCEPPVSMVLPTVLFSVISLMLGVFGSGLVPLITSFL